MRVTDETIELVENVVAGLLSEMKRLHLIEDFNGVKALHNGISWDIYYHIDTLKPTPPDDSA